MSNLQIALPKAIGLEMVQIRRRDKSSKVIVEERKYETVEAATTANARASSSPNMDSELADRFQPGNQEFAGSLGSDSSDEFSWVQRLQHIPDKASFLKPFLKPWILGVDTHQAFTSLSLLWYHTSLSSPSLLCFLYGAEQGSIDMDQASKEPYCSGPASSV